MSNYTAGPWKIVKSNGLRCISVDYAYLNDRVIGMDGNITRQEVWEARAAIAKAEGVLND